MRTARGLPFCYLCGFDFEIKEKRNPDHVPPTGLFALADRDFPLILPAHRQCNAARSAEDQVIGQLVGMLHGQKQNKKHNKLKVTIGRFQDGSRGVAIGGLDLRGIIRRWVRGFHAALYREYLPATQQFITCPPLPEAEPFANQVKFTRVDDVVVKFVEELRRNRATRTLDRIVCRNDKCRYECVWSQADNGAWICIYCLDLYQWINLGDTSRFEPRGCVGSYRRPGGGVPVGATCSTRLEFSVSSRVRLDPFSD
jgi:hypothetical protein